jgi:uncharacterized protein (DUF1015 family)
MPTFSPFVALRYSVADLTNVVAPPYDVLTDADRLALEARDPANSVRIDYPRDEDGHDRYELAANRLSAWKAAATLVSDSTPTFTVLRMTAVDSAGQSSVTTGVIGALALEPPAIGDILPHEQTTAKDKTDRLSLIRSTRINTSPIWALSMTVGLGSLLAPTGEPDAFAIDDEGVRHETWVISDPARIAEIATKVGASPVVVADGHHRFETALAYQSERDQADAGGHLGVDVGASAIMCLVVELAPQELQVRAIHRQIVSMPVELATPGSLRAALTNWFAVDQLPSTDATASEIAAGLVNADHLVFAERGSDGSLVTAALRPRPDKFDVGITLDSQRSKIACEAIGIEVKYVHDADAIAAAVVAGDSPGGLLLRPATVGQIREVAETRSRMPAKTTFFWPKPRTGLLFRSLD